MQRVYVKKGKKKVVDWFLIAGIVSAPLFLVVAVVQAFIREGFDIRRHAISTLTLGDAGWIQSVNFIVTGALAVLAAVGIGNLMRGGKGSTGTPWLVGLYGIGMIGAGLFLPDPGQSFPPGAPDGMPAEMSSSAAIHSLAFFVAFICLVAACFVMARRFAAIGDGRWQAYCIATGIVAPLLIAAGMFPGSWIGVLMGFAGVVAFGWVSLLSLRLRKGL